MGFITSDLVEHQQLHVQLWKYRTDKYRDKVDGKVTIKARGDLQRKYSRSSSVLHKLVDSRSWIFVKKIKKKK